MTAEPYAAALARKLRLKPGQTALMLGAPDIYTAAIRAILGASAVTIALPSEQLSTYDLVSLFARSQAEVSASASAAIAATRPGGALWIMWPKKTSQQAADLDRDTLWALIRPLGWGPVSGIAIDETWSALRFRPESDIQRRARS